MFAQMFSIILRGRSGGILYNAIVGILEINMKNSRLLLHCIKVHFPNIIMYLYMHQLSTVSDHRLYWVAQKTCRDVNLNTSQVIMVTLLQFSSN